MSNKISTKERILEKTKKLFARLGSEGVSMRTIADAVGISVSVLYYHFPDKDALLKEMFEHYGKLLGKDRAKLPAVKTASEMLKQRIVFQFEHAEEIVAILKYYFMYRQNFPHTALGFVPETAYLHIKEVLEYGQITGELSVPDLDQDAKVITHAINGFVLEYFPEKPAGKEKQDIINSISDFVLRGLKKGGD